MSSPEFEHPKPFTGEIDWSPETAGLKDFSARTREALHSNGYETFILNGLYFNDILSAEGVQEIAEIFAGQGYDFAKLRTMQSEVAYLASFFLPGSGSGTIQQEDIKLREYNSDLANIDGLESIRVCRGNLADYLAIIARFTDQRLHPKGLAYHIRTSTTDSEYGGTKGLEILFKGIDYSEGDAARRPKFNILSVSRYVDKKDIRIAPIIIPA
jgi:hypothetical protein